MSDQPKDEPKQPTPAEAADQSDSFQDQAALLPVENIKAPVKPAIDHPTIPKEDAEIAEKAKDDLQKGTE